MVINKKNNSNKKSQNEFDENEISSADNNEMKSIQLLIMKMKSIQLIIMKTKST